jgi:hypothetical protein
MNAKGFLILLVSFLTLHACNPYDFDEPWKKITDAEYAIPLINSKITIESALSGQDPNLGVRYDPDGTVVLTYNSEVVKKQAYQIFKPIVFPGSLFFQDSLLKVRFDQIDNYVVQKGTIRGDSIRYGFTSKFNEPITITMTIPEVFNQNGIFTKTVTIQPNSTLVTPLYSLRGYDFVSPSNYLTFRYDARKSNGERVLLDNAYFEFTYFLFDFVQGFLGQNTQKIYDNAISVNIFKQWQGGLLEFSDPKVHVRMDNSFGFPVKARVNNFEITQLGGQTVKLESTVFNNDIYFEYPKLNEIGMVKSTNFYFDKNNTNFATAFNQKMIMVSYDLDAIINPDNDPNFIGFFNFESYYLLNVGVELPLIFRAENFRIAQELDFESPLKKLEEVGDFEIKAYITNLFPVDVYAQLYFINNNGQTIDSLFAGGEKHFKAGILNTDGSVSPGEIAQPEFFKFGPERKEILSNSTKVLAKIRMSTTGSPGTYTKIKKDMGLDVQMGVRFKANFSQ